MRNEFSDYDIWLWAEGKQAEALAIRRRDGERSRHRDSGFESFAPANEGNSGRDSQSRGLSGSVSSLRSWLARAAAVVAVAVFVGAMGL